MAVPERGEIWQVDFGIAQKVRPALVVSIPFGDADRSLTGVIPHTTKIRDSAFEVAVPLKFLKEGAFLVQGLVAVPPKFFIRRLGRLSVEELRLVEIVLENWLGLRK
jgi:mRNA interferase MazF